MCSRFELNTSAQEIARQFSLATAPALPNSEEFRPTDMIVSVGRAGETGYRKWGISAPWDGKPIFNARLETVTEKPVFQPFLSGVCIVPASGFFEWTSVDHKRHKHAIRPASGLLAFAGLMDGEVAVILTRRAENPIKEIHTRMPVMLSTDQQSPWLSGELDIDTLREANAYVPGGVTVTPCHMAPPRQADLFS